ncbi:hypothetical protein BJX66DRAFT_308424, partial [Aspergillus keveii]
MFPPCASAFRLASRLFRPRPLEPACSSRIIRRIGNVDNMRDWSSSLLASSLLILALSAANLSFIVSRSLRNRSPILLHRIPVERIPTGLEL